MKDNPPAAAADGAGPALIAIVLIAIVLIAIAALLSGCSSPQTPTATPAQMDPYIDAPPTEATPSSPPPAMIAG